MGENDNNVYGASETNIMNDPYAASLGVLSGGKGAEVQALLNSLMPEPEKVDAAQLAIRFFSQMGANAAQPGSTALSAAASALPSAADYLAQVNKRNKELERARGPLAIQLASALKPPTSTAPVKVMVDGKAVYMSAAEAIKRGLPVYEKPTDTNKAPKAYSVTEENLVQLNKILGSNLTRDTLGNVLLTPSQFSLGQNFVGLEVKDDTSSSQPKISQLFDALEKAKVDSPEHDALLLEIESEKNKAGFNKELFDSEMKIQEKYTKSIQSLVDSEIQYNKMLSSFSAKNGPGDLAMIFGFMKMLDPGSVVRESEFSAAQDTAGLYQKLLVQAEKLKTGDLLTEPQRKNFLNLAKKYLEAGEMHASKIRYNKGYQVDKYGFDPANIFGVEIAPSSWYTNKDVYKKSQSGRVTPDAMWLAMTPGEQEKFTTTGTFGGE